MIDRTSHSHSQYVDHIEQFGYISHSTKIESYDGKCIKHIKKKCHHINPIFVHIVLLLFLVPKGMLLCACRCGSRSCRLLSYFFDQKSCHFVPKSKETYF